MKEKGEEDWRLKKEIYSLLGLKSKRAKGNLASQAFQNYIMHTAVLRRP